MKKLIMMAAVLLTATQLNAQDYKTGIGMRFGLSNGITARHNIDQYKAIEGILSFRWHGFNLTGLYELQYEDAFKVDHLNWYFGGGANIGIAQDEYYENDKEQTGSQLILGIDGVIGMEYNFNEVPLNISLDWKPLVNLTGADFIADEVAFSVRYLIK